MTFVSFWGFAAGGSEPDPGRVFGEAGGKGRLSDLVAFVCNKYYIAILNADKCSNPKNMITS